MKVQEVSSWFACFVLMRVGSFCYWIILLLVFFTYCVWNVRVLACVGHRGRATFSPAPTCLLCLRLYYVFACIGRKDIWTFCFVVVFVLTVFLLIVCWACFALTFSTADL